MTCGLFSLNRQQVESLRASQSHELFYLGNDDDERYSTQASKHLLKNLLVQAASPPLGYAVYYEYGRVYAI